MKLNWVLIFIAVGLFYIPTACGEDKIEDNILDEEAPTIACSNDIVVMAEPGANHKVVLYNSPIVTDNEDGVESEQIQGLASGDKFPIGITKNTFIATDASGNKSSCSFLVTVTEIKDDQPFAGENGVTAPEGKKWVKVDELSDEFNDDAFDDNKWHRNPASDGFSWYGRPPALFEAENVSVSDGNLNVTTLKYDIPKQVQGKTWTHGGAIIRSKAPAGFGKYYECRMKANKTIMSSTFWIAMKQNCNTGPIRKLELDIQECVGRVHSGTDAWASKWDKIFHSNAIRHNRSCDIGEETRASGVLNLDEANHDRFFVYACWWKSPTEILFYLDGEYVYSITPTTDFDIDGYITMAIETYDWNPVDEAGSIFETGSFDDLTTKYDWVRTWELEDE